MRIGGTPSKFASGHRNKLRSTHALKKIGLTGFSAPILHPDEA
jgi:hypothetical protein